MFCSYQSCFCSLQTASSTSVVAGPRTHHSRYTHAARAPTHTPAHTRPSTLVRPTHASHARATHTHTTHVHKSNTCYTHTHTKVHTSTYTHVHVHTQRPRASLPQCLCAEGRGRGGTHVVTRSSTPPPSTSTIVEGEVVIKAHPQQLLPVEWRPLSPATPTPTLLPH